MSRYVERLAKRQKTTETITIQILDKRGCHFTFYTENEDSTFEKLIVFCADCIGVPSSWISLVYNNRELKNQDTPELLEMKSYGMNVVELVRIGWIPILIRDHNLDQITPFNVKLTTTFEELQKAYLDSVGVSMKDKGQIFSFRSQQIDAKATPDSLGLQGNDEIEVGQEATMTLVLIIDNPHLPYILMEIKRSATMLQVKQQCLKRTKIGINPLHLSLVYKDREVENDDTPGSLWMTGNESVWVYLPNSPAEAA